MRAIAWSRALTGAACAAVLLAGSATAQAAEVPESFAPVTKDLLPAVVNISTTKTVEGGGGPFGQLPPEHPLRKFFDNFSNDGDQGRKRRLRSLGSGFIIDESGYIVTNDHVVREADTVTVILQDDSKLTAQVVGTDPVTDLAVLKVDAARDLPAVDWGDSGAAEIGDWVLAIGNPFGLGGSVTAGIVSARGRDIDAGPYSRFIQTDTAINQGNSGGPLFDLDGEVIGVNTAILSPNGGSVGVGFALPARVAEPIVAELRADGEITRGWLGVTVQPVTDDLAEGLGLPGDSGALIGSIASGGPAADAGLAQGDVIVGLGDRTIQDAGQLAWLVSQRDPGESVELTLWRGGEKMAVEVELGELPNERMAAADPQGRAQPDGVVAKSLGMKLARASEALRRRLDLPEDVTGAVVARVAQAGPAASRGIRPGDVIAQVGQRTVETPADVRETVADALRSGAESVVFLVRRDDRARYVSVPLARPETG